ncbi:MAG: single- stranded DNA-binding family protein [Desulfurococcaceae archaeon]
MEVRTGPIRLSSYGIKLRRVVNASLYKYFKEGTLNQKEVNALLSDVNAKLYSLFVEKYVIPKDAIVNIALDYEVEEGKLKIKGMKVEVYILDETLSTTLTEDAKRALGLS